MTRRTSPPAGGLSDQPDLFSVDPSGVMHALDGVRWPAHEQFVRSFQVAATRSSTCRNGSRRRNAGLIAGRAAAEVPSLFGDDELVAG